ncbi:MAG: SCP2 sterol-binding domain-containing protein [Spiribacter sp.]|jgi:ubiquinone biosynthesis protein UbiJ|nr:SCP2 sterol-binding domain-containing protein [Spiribacter sp.]MDR9489364.1 SCP2 sterol-binding domain-containing protein [Spiribacter sp.]
MSTEWLPLTPIEQGINRILSLDPESAERLAVLSGRDLGLRLTDPSLALRICFDSEGLTLISDDTDMSDCDALLEASLAGLTGLALSRGRRSRDVSFHGDIGTIQEVRSIFSDLNVDMEAQLSRLVGDTLAARLGQGARAGRAWSERSARALLENIAELATEERRWLPTGAEANHFLTAVDQIQEDVDRLEARLKRLERREPSEPSS